MPRIEPIPMDELSPQSRKIVELGFTCASSMGLHRFLHTLDVYGDCPPIVEYTPEQVDGRFTP
jgi:hypothetical protein